MKEYDITNFLNKLEDPRLLEIYKQADSMVLEHRDTLSDEFQLSATICEAIREWVAEKIEERIVKW